MILGSLYVTLGAIVVGVPVGILTAVFMARFCPEKIYNVLKPSVELLAGIPSVVYGFFGLVVMVPFIREHIGGTGSSMLTASLLLGMMILPTLISVAEAALRAVPDSYYEGALALGAGHVRSVFFTVVPAAKSGIMAAIILGMGRAVGETMAVIMVAGNQARMPIGILEGVRTMTTNIVIEMGYAADLHRDALIATAVVLFVFILIINLTFSYLKGKVVQQMTGLKAQLNRKLHECGRDPLSLFLLGCVIAAALITFMVLSFLLGYILWQGLPNIETGLFALQYNSENVSLFPALVDTVLMVIMALAIATPLGIFAAVYLVEYASRGNRLVSLVRVTADTLAGIPSIVYGLFGMLFFVTYLKWGYSLLAGACTVAIMILPLIMRTTEEALKAIPDSYREGSYGLGAGKLRTVFAVVLPSAVPGILAGVILSIGRIVGETAALIYTAGTVAALPDGVLSSGRTLAVHMYVLASEGLYMKQAYATAVILVVIVVAINALSSRLAKQLMKGK